MLGRCNSYIWNLKTDPLTDRQGKLLEDALAYKNVKINKKMKKYKKFYQSDGREVRGGSPANQPADKAWKFESHQENIDLDLMQFAICKKNKEVKLNYQF